jgi:sarcosine oxidase, subunit gamma
MAELRTLHAENALHAGITALSAGAILEVADRARVLELRGDPADSLFTQVTSKVLQLSLPTGGAVQSSRGCDVLWLRPTGWLLSGPCTNVDTVRGEIEPLLKGTHATLTDLSHALTVLELSGPDVRQLLARGCSLDLHPRVFGIGGCTRTVIADITVLIHHVSAANRYRVYVDYSQAHFLRDWLSDAATGLTRTN